MHRKHVFRVAKLLLIGVLALTVFTTLVWGLWNWLMPTLFGLHTVTVWQALGLLVLSKILFSGFRGRPCGPGHWRSRMAERWDQMSLEEREQFRAGIRTRCGPGTSADPIPEK